MKHGMFAKMRFCLLGVSIGLCAVALADPGIVLPVEGGFVQVDAITERIFRVSFAKDKSFFDRKSFAVVAKHDSVIPHPLKFSKVDLTSFETGKVKVTIDTRSGRVSFYTLDGKPILQEAQNGRSMEPAMVQGESTYHVRQSWRPTDDESLYGLGQNQLGLVDIKGYDLDLWQHNTSIAIPFLVSSRGYGVLWDNPSYTKFGDIRPFEAMPPSVLTDKTGKPGGLTATYFSGTSFGRLVTSRRETKIDFAQAVAGQRPSLSPGIPRGNFSVRWEGTVTAPKSGDYQFQSYYHSGLKLWLGGRLLMDHWRQSWLPWFDLAKVHLLKGQKTTIRIEYVADQGQPVVQFKWKTPSESKATSLWSEVGEGTDYYFVYGPSIDEVIAGYRRLTGQAPMPPKWTFGLFQSRQRYETQQQSLDAIDGFRERGLPFDTIVQDWFYWKADEWGSHQFDPARFPDPTGWIKSIHEKNSRLMISVWPKFYPGTENFKEMNALGYLYQPNLTERLQDWTRHSYTFYDAFNPDARKLFWSQVSRELLAKDVDAWWMDASEPDLLPSPTLEGTKTHMNPTAMGTASRVLNAYPLVNAQAIYEGQRKDAPDKRVFILTRSGYAGQQRYGTASWSGDTSSTWTAMRKQIQAGLSFSISGVPYWTMDSGGFSVPGRFSTRNPKPEDVDEWRELNTRWFEFATFVPFLRVHGEYPYREMWQFGGSTSPAFKAQQLSDQWRYMMIPYVYSLAGMVHREGSTIMRPLVMDFSKDAVAREVVDQYMFGPSLMVCPVTEYKVRSRMVYFPQTPGGWYLNSDHAVWHEGGTWQLVAAPYDQIPVFAPAGAILPTCDPMRFVGEEPNPALHVDVFSGSNGQFTLYEDDGLTYRYEKGEFSTIPIRWNDSTRTLTIGERSGSYKGMATSKSFDISLITRDHHPHLSRVEYAGKAVSVKLL